MKIRKEVESSLDLIPFEYADFAPLIIDINTVWAIILRAPIDLSENDRY